MRTTSTAIPDHRTADVLGDTVAAEMRERILVFFWSSCLHTGATVEEVETVFSFDADRWKRVVRSAARWGLLNQCRRLGRDGDSARANRVTSATMPKRKEEGEKMIKQAKVKVIRGKWYREVFPEEGMGKRQWVSINNSGKHMRNNSNGCLIVTDDFTARVRNGQDNSHLTFEVEVPDPPTLKVWFYPTSTVGDHIRPAIPTPETWTFRGRLDVERVVREAGYRPCVIEAGTVFVAAYMGVDGFVGWACCTSRDSAEREARERSAKPHKYTVTVLE